MFGGRLKINKFSKFVSKYKGQGAKVWEHTCEFKARWG